MSARAGDPGQPGTTGGAPFTAGQTILPGKPFVAPFAPAPAAAAPAPAAAPVPTPAPAPVASGPEPVAAPPAPASAAAPTDELPPLVAQLAPPPILPPSEIDQAKPKGRRQVDPKLLLLVLLAVVAVAAAYWFFLKPSSSDETFVPPVHHKAPAAATQHTLSTLPASFAGLAQAPASTAAGKAWHTAAAPFTKAGYRTVVGGIYTHAGTPELGYVAAASPRAAARAGSLAVAAFAASIKQANPKATFVEKPVAAGPLGGTAVCGSATGLPLGYCTWRDADTAGAVFGIAKDLPALLVQVRAAVEH